MIFKTFNNDIDKWTAKIGIFGKSFNELGTAVNNAFKSVIDNLDNFDENVGFWESLKNNLLPKKEDITSQLIDVMPEINTDNLVDATEKIKILSKDVANGTTTWQELFDTLPEGQKHFAQLGQQMEGQIITTEGVAKANQAARASAIAHNEALKQQTLSAKAGQVALKGLAIAGNMLAGMAISFAISKAIEGIDYLIHREERLEEAFNNAKESAQSFRDEMKNIQKGSAETASSANKIADSYAKLVQGVNPYTNENVSLSNEQYEEFLNFNEQLADLFPSLTQNYDENGNAILGLGGSIETVTGKIAALVEQQERLAKADLKKNLENYVNGDDENGGQLDVISGYADKLEKEKDKVEDFKKELNTILNGGTDDQDYLNQKSLNKAKKYYKDKFGLTDEELKQATSIETNFLGEGIYRLDFSKLEIDEDRKTQILNSYNTFLKELEGNIQTTQAELDNANQEMSDQMMIWVEDMPIFDDNQSIQTAITKMVGSIDWSSLGITDLEGAKQYIQQTIFNPISKALDSPDDKLEVTNALSKLFTLDLSKMPVEEAKKAIDGFLTTIMNILNQGVPDAEKKTLDDMYKMFGFGDVKNLQKQYDIAITKAKKQESDFDWDSWFKENSINTQEEIDRWNKIAESATNAADARKKYTEGEEDNKTDISSFSDVWNSADFSDAKDKLLELAKAGELTPETLESTEEYNKLLTQTGLTAEQVANKINKMVTTSDQLASMSSGLKPLSENLGTKRETKQAIDADTLAGMPDELKECTEEWKEYERVMGDASSSYDKCKKATNELATAFVNSNNFLANLTSKTEGQYISQLKLMGVENAEAVVTETLNNKIEAQSNLEKAAKEKKIALANATWEEIASTDTYNNALENARVAMQKLYVQENILANSNLGLQGKVNELKKFVKATLGAAVASQIAAKAMHQVAVEEKSGWSTPDYQKSYNKNYIKEFNKLFKQIDLDFSIDPPNETGSNSKSKSSNSKSKAKESKQIIDWIVRKLNVLQQKIDITKAKFDNLFSLKRKNSNLDSQIEHTRNLLNAQEKVVSRYQNRASSFYKKNKKKFSKNGITLSMLQNGSYNIKSYKSSISELVNTYQDYYDKAQDAKKATYELLTQIKELSKQKLELKLNDNERKRSYIDAKYENATTAKVKSSILDRKIETYKSDDKAYDNYYSYAKKLRNKSGDKAKSALSNAKNITKSTKTKIKNLIKKGKEIPSNLLKAIKKKNVNVYNKLVEYNNNVDFVSDVLRDKKLANEENKKNTRDDKIEKEQQFADEAEARYNLNQQYASNAIYAKDKNKYEAKSLKDLKEQYIRLINIAKLEGDVTEQNRLQAEWASKKEESLKNQYDNIKDEYDRQTSLNNSRISTVQAEISALEANGKVASEAFYKGLIQSTTDNKTVLLNQLADLKAQLSNFTPDSNNWYLIQEDIEATTQAIYGCDESLAEFQKSWNELKLRKFDLVNSEFEFANDHIDFLTDYLSHKDLTSEDSAGLTDDGFATISLNFSKMANNAKIVENAQKGLAELQQQIANGTSKLTEEEQLEAINKYIEIIRDAKLGIEDLKDSILDLVDNAFDVMLDSLNELIEQYRKSIQNQKDLYEYQRKIANQTKTIASIQKQIAALSNGNDNSEETRARLQKLQVQLEESKQDLKDTEYDKWISDTEDILDDLSEDMEDFFENLMKNPEKLLSNIEKAINDNAEMIAATLEKYGLGDANSFNTVINPDGSKTVNTTDYGDNKYQNDYDKNGVSKDNNYNPNTSGGTALLTDTSKTQDGTQKEKDELLKKIQEEIRKQAEARKAEEAKKQAEHKKQNDRAAVYQRAEDILKTNGTNKIVAVTPVSQSAVKDAVSEFLSTSALHKPTTETGKKRMKTDPFLKYIAKKYSNKTLSPANEIKLGALLGVGVKNKNEVSTAEANRMLKAFKAAGFSKGGVAKFDSGVLRKVGEDGLILARNGEGFVRPEDVSQMKEFMKVLPTANNLIDNLVPLHNMSIPISNKANNPISIGDVNVHLDGSRVVDMDSMFDQLKDTQNKKRLLDCVSSPLLSGNMLSRF